MRGVLLTAKCSTASFMTDSSLRVNAHGLPEATGTQLMSRRWRGCRSGIFRHYFCRYEIGAGGYLHALSLNGALFKALAQFNI